VRGARPSRAAAMAFDAQAACAQFRAEPSSVNFIHCL
jgi:hypothetical protein